MSQLDVMVTSGYLAAIHRDNLRVVHSASELLSFVENYRAPQSE